LLSIILREHREGSLKLGSTALFGTNWGVARDEFKLVISSQQADRVGGDMLRVWDWLPSFIAIVISLLLGCVRGAAQSVTAETASPVILPAKTSVILPLKESLYKKEWAAALPRTAELLAWSNREISAGNAPVV